MKTTHPDLTETRPIPVQSMAALVWGAPAPRRMRLPTRVIFMAAVLGASMGCATARQASAPDVEAVGALSASATHVYVAPVHATTDLTPGFQAIEGADDDATETVTTVTRAPDASVAAGAGEADASELPEVAPKSDGVTLGGAR